MRAPQRWQKRAVCETGWAQIGQRRGWFTAPLTGSSTQADLATSASTLGQFTRGDYPVLALDSLQNSTVRLSKTALLAAAIAARLLACDEQSSAQ
jgi:hypothetical protein